MADRPLIPWPTLRQRQRPAPKQAAPIPSPDVFYFHQLELPQLAPKSDAGKHKGLKRSTHFFLCALLALVIFAPATLIWWLHTHDTPFAALLDQDHSQEIVVTPGYAAEVRAGGLPITVQRAFKGSHVAGLSGEASEILAQRFPPAESSALLQALKRRNPEYTWTEVQATATNLGTGGLFAKLLVPDFLPENDASLLLYGRPPGGEAREILIDRSRGLLYYISSRS